MTKKFFSVLILFLIFIQTIFVDHSFAITAEERLEEVEKQLIAIANQIKQYEGDKTDLEKAILANDSSLKKVNDELAEVQRRLVAAELALEKALEGYDESLNNLAAVQQNIVNEQVTLGRTKNEIAKVKDELAETQKNLNSITSFLFYLLPAALVTGPFLSDLIITLMGIFFLFFSI